MLAATFLAIFFVPLFFVLIGKMNQRIRGRAGIEPPPVSSKKPVAAERTV
jgi:hypothetical protein